MSGTVCALLREMKSSTALAKLETALPHCCCCCFYCCYFLWPPLHGILSVHFHSNQQWAIAKATTISSASEFSLYFLSWPAYLCGICLAASGQRYRCTNTDIQIDRLVARDTQTGRQKRWPVAHCPAPKQTGTKASLEMVSKINATGKIERVISVLSVSISIYLCLCVLAVGIGNSESFVKQTSSVHCQL